MKAAKERAEDFVRQLKTNKVIPGFGRVSQSVFVGELAREFRRFYMRGMREMKRRRLRGKA